MSSCRKTFFEFARVKNFIKKKSHRLRLRPGGFELNRFGIFVPMPAN